MHYDSPEEMEEILSAVGVLFCIKLSVMKCLYNATIFVIVVIHYLYVLLAGVLTCASVIKEG